MKKTLRTLAAGAVLAAAAVVAPAAAGTSAPAQAVTCGSPDGVYTDNQGVNASGTLYWSSNRSGSYRITLRDYARDGHYGVMYVQYYKHGVGWVDRERWTVGDGSTGYANGLFSKSYQVDMVAFGVGRSGEYVFTVVWDRNAYCGA